MKLIVKPEDLRKEFKRLIDDYNDFNWSTAWASAGSIFFAKLLLNRDKIQKLTVGIHFYQTHPNFIKEFVDDPVVHFIEQPEGTFHPKK